MFKDNRKPAVAGKFYPALTNELKLVIKEYLEKADLKNNFDQNIKVLMVPHAAYCYSGLVAAHAYKQIIKKKVKTVFLIGNAHTSNFKGVAIDDSDFWETPLGNVVVDLDVIKRFENRCDYLRINREYHKFDHILEVQLPFLQVIFGSNFKIVPMLIGQIEHEQSYDFLELIKNEIGNDDLIIISSDMSHYPFYDDAYKIDLKTLELIKSKNVNGLMEHIIQIESEQIGNEETLLCSFDSVKLIMELAQALNWKGKILNYATSGDVNNMEKQQVVGYGALSFSKSVANNIDNELSARQKEILLQIAKKSVERFVQSGEVLNFDIFDDRLNKTEGAFVTLKKSGKLCGCIGNIVSNNKPLWQVVRDMAIEACSSDYRFEPIKKDELEEIEYEISVLSCPVQIKNWKEIELGKHGVIVEKEYNKGVFLPQVADETNWNLEEFLSHLCADKAGIEYDCYKNDSEVVLKIFTAQVFCDSLGIKK